MPAIYPGKFSFDDSFGGNLPGTRPNPSMPGFGLTVTSYGEILGGIFAKYGPPVRTIVVHSSRMKSSPAAVVQSEEPAPEAEPEPEIPSAVFAQGLSGAQTGEPSGLDWNDGKTTVYNKRGEEGAKYQQGQKILHEVEAGFILAELAFDIALTIATAGTGTIAKKGIQYAERKLVREAVEEIGEIGSRKLIKEAVEEGIEYEMHHTIPKQIQKMLREEIRHHKDIIGRKGLPNRMRIPKELHRRIHSGPWRGGYYNRKFIKEINKRGGFENITVNEVLQIRDELVKKFKLVR